MNRATFAAGCFWGVEEAFRVLDGVHETAVGYLGGTTEKPTYEQVCSGETGHAEAVDLLFDPSRISYEKLLERFFSKHDPTSLNRQGLDIGSQYRSAVFYHSDEQRQQAQQYKQQLELSGRYDGPLVTEIIPAATFWRAEEYHQKYLCRRR